ncbi:hypothetical protein PTKIN_Ptkin16aG0501200 [Pterospermum kingtungense]
MDNVSLGQVHIEGGGAVSTALDPDAEVVGDEPFDGTKQFRRSKRVSKPPGYSSFKAREFDRALLTIKNSEFLTLCKSTLEFNRLKELWWIDNYSKGLYSSDALITFLKLCPSLERLFLTIDHNSYAMPSAASCSEQVGRYTKLQHLKVVKLEGFANQEDEILFAERLQDVVAVEPLILVAWDAICFRNLIKVSCTHKFRV